jgi:hypothetical protein
MCGGLASMSNYFSEARNPKTGKTETVEFLDYGHEGYWIRFSDGELHHENEIEPSEFERWWQVFEKNSRVRVCKASAMAGWNAAKHAAD